MSTIYLDPTVSGTGTGTFADPYRQPSSISWAAGNFYLWKEYTTTILSSTLAPGASGTPGNPITVGTYHAIDGSRVTDGSSRAIFSGSNLTHITGVGSGRSGITWDSIEVAGSGRTAGVSDNGISLVTSGTGLCIIRNCLVRDVPDSGIYVQPAQNNYPVSWLIENNTVYNTGSVGILWTGSGYSYVIRGNTVHDTGYKTASFGIANYPHKYSGAVTWALDAGAVYKATLANQTFENPLTFIEGVFIATGSGWNLVETTNAVNLPGSGEYGFNAGTLTLYVNIGADPGASTVSIGYGRMRGWVIEGNTVFDTNNLASEGNAIQGDDLSANGTIRANLVYGRIKHGIVGNKGRSLNVVGNVCLPNVGRGIYLGDGRDNTVRNNVVSRAAGTTSCMYFDGALGTTKVDNNVFVGGTYAIERGVGGGTNTAVTNNCYGQTIAEGLNITPTGSVTSDPQLDDRYKPLNAALRGVGTFLGGLDFYGREFPSPPDIGAVQHAGISRGSASRSLSNARDLKSPSSAFRRGSIL